MKSVQNAVRVLELIDETAPEIGVSDVVRRLGVPKSTASRILSALSVGGLLEQDSKTRRYRPGPLAFRLGRFFERRGSLLDTVREAASKLASETGHSTWVGVIEGTDVVILHNTHGGYPVRFVVEPGSRLPAHATATGKAILACLTDEELRALYPKEGLSRRTDSTIKTVAALMTDLDRARKRGYTESNEEVFPGIKSIGVGFRDGSTIAGLGLSYPLSSVSQTGHPTMLEALLRAADWVRARSGSSSGTSRGRQ